MKHLFFAAALAVAAFAPPAQAGNGLDGVTLTLGKFSINERGAAQQTLSAKNGTSSPIPMLDFGCGFLRGNLLIATSVHYLMNLQAGQTGYQTVTTSPITNGGFPDHADCRMYLPG